MNASALLAPCSALACLWVASLWQGLVLAAFTILLLRTKRQPAQLRYRVWLIGYCACLLLPVVECLVSTRSSGTGFLQAFHESAPTTAFAPLLTFSSRWTLLFTALWITGSSFAVLRLGAGLWSIRHLLRSAVPLQSGEMAMYLPLLQLRSRGPVMLFVSDDIDTPVAVGLGKPAIVLPGTLLARLSTEQTEQVLRHEMEHLARRDDWVTLLLGCIRCIFPVHPALAWFERQLVTTREMVCDDAVLRSATPRAYATNLAQIAECSIRRNSPVVPGLLGTRSQLSSRIDYILTGQRKSATASSQPLFSALAGLLVLSALLVSSPALVTFQGPATAVVARRTVRIPAAPARVLTLAAPPRRIRRMATQVRRPRTTRDASHLLAIAHQPVAPYSADIAGAAAHSLALLVLWHDPTQGFYATFVFDLQPALRGRCLSRHKLFFHET